MLNGPTDR